MVVAYGMDGYLPPARGARGGLSGSVGAAYKVGVDGTAEPLPNMAQVTLAPGEWMRGEHGGGGGYGDPHTRDPARVLEDVLEGYVSVEAAHAVYGVAFTGSADDATLAIDRERTEQMRAESR